MEAVLFIKAQKVSGIRLVWVEIREILLIFSRKSMINELACLEKTQNYLMSSQVLARNFEQNFSKI